MKANSVVDRSSWLPGIFRGAGIGLLALIAFVFPEVGGHRFLLGGILLGLIVPFAVWIECKHPMTRFGASQPMLDTICCGVLIHLVPQAWIPTFLIGALSANSTAVHLHRSVTWMYPLLNLGFIAAMVLAAVVHDVENWLIPAIAYLACMPSRFSYIRWNMKRQVAAADRNQRLQNLSLIAGGAAHDFNNILAGIAGFAEVASAGLPEGHPSRKIMNSLLQGTKRGKLLTGQLLALSNRDVRCECDLDLVNEIREFVPLLKSIAKTDKIEVLASHDQVPIRGDRAQIQQLFMNLILNAAESMNGLADDVVRVCLDLEQCESTGQNISVCTISDSGCGISPSEISRVFEPFYSTKANGSGMGLASTQRFVQQHGGEIRIDSQPGHGTTVTVTLPALKLQPGGVLNLSKLKQSETDSLSHRVLLVDDDASIRDALRLLLRQVGFDVVAVESGNEAIEMMKFSPERFDCVLLDLKMPVMNGWECRRELQKLSGSIPIVLMSGYAPEPPAGEEIEDGKFLSKPFTKEGLSHVIGNVLGVSV